MLLSNILFITYFQHYPLHNIGWKISTGSESVHMIAIDSEICRRAIQIKEKLFRDFKDELEWLSLWYSFATLQGEHTKLGIERQTWLAPLEVWHKTCKMGGKERSCISM